MAGKIKKLLNAIIEKRAQGNPTILAGSQAGLGSSASSADRSLHSCAPRQSFNAIRLRNFGVPN